jgi:hypothetical protein
MITVKRDVLSFCGEKDLSCTNVRIREGLDSGKRITMFFLIKKEAY